MTFEVLLEQVQKLSPAQRPRMIELLTVTLQADLAHDMDWHTALRATYGILADDPIERPPHLSLEEREPVGLLVVGYPAGNTADAYH